MRETARQRKPPASASCAAPIAGHPMQAATTAGRTEIQAASAAGVGTVSAGEGSGPCRPFGDALRGVGSTRASVFV